MIPTNPKTPSLRERIGQVLLDCARPLHIKGRHIMCVDGVEEILLAIKEALPEKCPGCGFKHEHPQICNGWNDAIEEMERRLGLGTESTNKKP